MTRLLSPTPRRVLRVVIACTLFSGWTAAVQGQMLRSEGTTFSAPPTHVMEEEGQIIDRPASAPLRPVWGVTVGVSPLWWTPSWGAYLFESAAARMDFTGRDLRLGIVRGRPLGFEFGMSLVQKTFNRDFVIVQNDRAEFGTDFPVVSYRGIDDVTVVAGDSHVLLPVKRIGNRAQLGVLLGGGLGFLPDTPIERRVEGPPFYASCPATSFGASGKLLDPPASGGFVYDFQCLPVPAGSRAGATTEPVSTISASDTYWLLIRAMVAADVVVTTPLKVRFSGGFTYPGLGFGVDLVYLVRARR